MADSFKQDPEAEPFSEPQKLWTIFPSESGKETDSRTELTISARPLRIILAATFLLVGVFLLKSCNQGRSKLKQLATAATMPEEFHAPVIELLAGGNIDDEFLGKLKSKSSEIPFRLSLMGWFGVILMFSVFPLLIGFRRVPVKFIKTTARFG